MAQYVKYFENDVTYTEGPFVVCDMGGKYRVECELKGNRCPALCDSSIYELREKHFKKIYGLTQAEIEHQVDWLNEQVKLGNIVQIDGQWRC